MNILIIACRNSIGARIHRALNRMPNIKAEWYSGVRQQGTDFYLGDDFQALYSVTPDLETHGAESKWLPTYELAVVIESGGGESLDGDLRSYQIAGFLAGRSIPTFAASDSREVRQWFVDYGAARTMTIKELNRDLKAIVERARENGLERPSEVGLKGLTLWQPWAWAVANGKDIENRHFITPYRGLVAFHASAPEFQPRGAYESSCGTLRQVLDSIGKIDLAIPAYKDLPKGVFFAVGRIIDCQPRIESPWYDPMWSQCFRVKHLHVLPQPVPGPTKPLLFDIDQQTAQKILAQMPGLK